MDVLRPNCRSRYCWLCHWDVPSEVFEYQSTGYLRPTVASTSRFLENPKARYVRKFRSKALGEDGEEASLAQESLFLKLPPEIRLRIYAMCFEERIRTRPRHICHWFEGGGWHVDGPRNPPVSFELTTYSSVPASLLRVNKQINREATRELYRQVSLQMSFLTPFRPNILDYWLRKHPLRFTKSLTISNDLSRVYIRPGITAASRSVMDYYKVLVNLMPNLGTLIILFQCWAQFVGPYMDGGLDLREKAPWLRNVKLLRDTIKEKISLILRFDSHDMWAQRHPWQSGPLKPTSSEVIECLTKHRFVLSCPNADVSNVEPPFDMVRNQDKATTAKATTAKPAAKLSVRRSDIRLCVEYGKENP